MAAGWPGSGHCVNILLWGPVVVGIYLCLGNVISSH